MKVLWFANTPCLAAEKLNLNQNTGGWLKSLNEKLAFQQEIDLSICFYWNDFLEPFQYKNTMYYPVHRKAGNKKIGRFIRRIANKTNDKKELKILIQIIETVKPDIIHVHGTEDNFGLIQKKIKKIPIVISIQGNITVYNYKWYSGITKKAISKNTTIIDKLLFKNYNAQKKSFIKRARREEEILSMTKNVMGRTDWDKRITSIMAPNNKYFHNDEILRDSFYSKQWSRHVSVPFNIFTTNGSNIYKGIEVVLYAANLLDNTGLRYKWHIAGLSSDDQLIKLAIKSYGITLSKNIIFEGKIDSHILLEKLLDSHLYVMPSHIENSPNNLCEAMILGLPCIAADVGGTSSLLTNKKDGILIQDGDPWSLAGAILEMRNNYDRAIDYGNNARKRALERHNPDKIVNDILNIYKDIINNNNK